MYLGNVRHRFLVHQKNTSKIWIDNNSTAFSRTLPNSFGVWCAAREIYWLFSTGGQVQIYIHKWNNRNRMIVEWNGIYLCMCITMDSHRLNSDIGEHAYEINFKSTSIRMAAMRNWNAHSEMCLGRSLHNSCILHENLYKHVIQYTL